MEIRQVRMKDCSEPKLNGKLGRSEAQQKTMGPWMTMVSIQFHPLVASCMENSMLWILQNWMLLSRSPKLYGSG